MSLNYLKLILKTNKFNSLYKKFINISVIYLKDCLSGQICLPISSNNRLFTVRCE